MQSAFRVEEMLRSPSVISALATIAFIALLRRSLFAFKPPRPIDIGPSIDELPDTPDARKLREQYPKDTYPNGSSFHTPWGKVQYWILGDQGPKIVLVNGIAIPAIIWHKIAPQLVQRGFQVLIYDHFGRGYSSAPDVPYSAALYTTQLALLMQYVGWRKAAIVGLSMGGGITAAFAANHPHLVDGRVAFIAPAGLLQRNDLSTVSLLSSSKFALAIFDSSFVKLFFNPADIVVSRARRARGGIESIPALQAATLSGYARALASTLRHGPLTGLQWAYKLAGESNFRVLHIHGDQDKTVPYTRTTQRILAFVPRVTHVKLVGAGHDLCHDDRYVGQIVESLCTFLRG